MDLLSILATLAPVFGIMLLGAFADRRQILPASTAQSMNLFVYWFSLPLLLFSQMARLSADQIPPAASSGYVLALGLVLAVGWIFNATVLKEDTKDSLLLALMGSFPNAAFMGLPVVLLLYPDHDGAVIIASLAAVLTSFNMVFTDTMLSALSGHSGGWGQLLLRALRSLYRNPALVCSALGAVVGLAAVPVPEAVLTITRMVGSTAAPCALFCMGMALSAQLTSLPGKAGRFGQPRRQCPVHVCKLLLSPLLVFALAYAMGERGPVLVAATVVAAMPTAVVAYVLAEKYAVLPEEASVGTVVNTLLSVLSLPLVIALAQWGAG